MDVNSGHLVSDLDQLRVEDRARYKAVPKHLQDHAARELKGRAETYVDLRGPSKLSRWARAKRKEARRSKRRQAAASRRKNRR